MIQVTRIKLVAKGTRGLPFELKLRAKRTYIA